MGGMRFLVVEDEPKMAALVARALREEGHAADVAGHGEDALWMAGAAPYDAIVLDLMLPKVDGLSVLERLRKAKNPAGVLVLTAKDTVNDRVAGLDLGADDYLVKPFAFEELLARVRAVLRRRYHRAEGSIRIGDLEVDTTARKVLRGGRDIVLSGREYALLEYLASRRGQVVSRSEILDHVYDFRSEPSSNVVDVYVGYLRRKLEPGDAPKLIHTRRGLGYVLEEES